MTSIHAHVAEARGRLRQAGLSQKEADLGARLLAEHVLGWSAERYFTSGHEAGPADFAPKYGALVERRVGREPLAYIVGRQEFWGLPFAVSSAVLIPRPETELIVEAALELFPGADRGLSVADVCTGCGCVAVALATERPGARVIAADISDDALQMARRNAEAHGVGSRVRCIRADLLNGLNGPFDVITANPPYVAERDRPGMQPEVRDHEPDVALFGGPDGTRIVERLVSEAGSRLRTGGYLIFEFGLGHDETIEMLVERAHALELIELKRDLQGVARTAIVRRL